MAEVGTRGPWRWEFNATSKSIHLVGGRPMFDKTVMDFQRWGMGRACPRFNEAAAGGQYHIMTRVSDRTDWLQPFPGREHHASWLQEVIHPDARLIAAAPLLLEALQAMLALDADNQRGGDDEDVCKEVEMARAAVAAATGDGL